MVSVEAITENGTYKIGDVINLTVNFSEAVTVTGEPGLTLETGVTDRVANYVSGSGTSALTFTYTVQAGDVSADLEYHSSAVISFNGGTIESVSGVAARLDLPAPGGPNSLAGTSNVVIDGIRPTITSVAVPANATYSVGDNLDFTVKLSEAVVVGGTPRIGIILDTGGLAYAEYLSGSTTNELAFRFKVTTGLKDADGITLASALDLNGGTLTDAAGNQVTGLSLVAPSTANILVDSVQAGGGGAGGGGGGDTGGGGSMPTPTPTTPHSGKIINAMPSADGRPVEITGGPGIEEVRIAGSVVLGAGLENAVLTGTGDFSAAGNELDNIIYGNAGNNAIFISGGNDFIDGELGYNTAVFSGPASQYSVKIVGGVAQVTNLSTGDVSTIANVSTLAFSDGDQPLFATGQALVSGFYQAFLGRPLDQAGFEFWMGQSLEGAGPSAIANHFINAPEFVARTASLSPAELVRALYENFLQRAQDSAGQAYWIQAIANGMSYGEVAANFVLSQEVGTRIDELFNRNDWLGIA